MINIIHLQMRQQHLRTRTAHKGTQATQARKTMMTSSWSAWIRLDNQVAFEKGKMVTIALCCTVIICFSKWICASVGMGKHTSEKRGKKRDKQLNPCIKLLWRIQVPGNYIINPVGPAFRQLASSAPRTSSSDASCKCINNHQHKLPASAGPSPPPSSVLVLELRCWQHDVKLNGRPRGYQVFWFRSSSCFLGITASSMNTSWLCSVGTGHRLTMNFRE